MMGYQDTQKKTLLAGVKSLFKEPQQTTRIGSVLNFAEHHAVSDKTEAENSHSKSMMKILSETSRSIIRATSLRPLPDVHVSSIYQVVFLGS